MLSGELEYLKNNCVEADDIVHSFMETCEKNEDLHNLTLVENKPGMIFRYFRIFLFLQKLIFLIAY